MKITAVICEYNPLHSGHVYQINQARLLTSCDYVVCIMSGNCVQRGELAVLDKYTRAVHAIKAGADCIIELPSEYVLASAKQFALGGVKIANLFKAQTTLCFGSECGDLSLLEKFAKIEEDQKLQSVIKQNLKTGIDYPSALHLSLKQYGIDPAVADIAGSPNNLLGAEYIKSIHQTSSNLDYVTVKRNNGYNDTSLDGVFASSSAIRNALNSGQELPSDYLPQYCINDLENTVSDDSRLFSVIKYALTSFDLYGIYDDIEGLVNRLRKSAIVSQNYNEFIQNAKTKRYTTARIKRLALNCVLNNTFTHTQLTDKPVPFVNILAVNKDSRNVLGLIDCNVATTRKDLIPFISQNAVTDKADKLFKSVKYDYKDNARFI